MPNEKEKILDFMKKGKKPFKAQEIADQLSIDKKIVDKAIKLLKEDNSIESPKKCYYQAK